MGHEVVLTETLVETLEQFETQDAERIINKLEDIGSFPGHFLDRLKNHPGYKLRVGDFRVLIDWDKDNEVVYAIEAFERKKKSTANLGSIGRYGGRGETVNRKLSAVAREKDESADRGPESKGGIHER